MPRVIFKCPYLKGGSERAASHLHNYVRYMATREGAQHMAIGHEQLPATEEQRKMVAQLLREFPLSRGLFEYEDYQTAPTRGNASEFITRALEDNYDQIAKRDNYVSYIASRPRAQRAGAHALFTGSDAPLVLSQIAAEVAHHPGNVWLPIISLRREDAARLGYDDAGQWKNLIAGYAMEMAEAMKIPWEQFRWYAAFHDQGHHPHIHMVCYSADGRSGYLTREGIARIKSDLAKRIFHQELHELYERQTQRRDELTQEAGVVMAELVQQMWEGTLDNPRIEQFMEHLAGKLKNVYVTGDTHGGFQRLGMKYFPEQKKMNREDMVIIAGDFGGLWGGTPAEKYWLDWLEDKPFTTAFLDGNHENFAMLNALPERLWHGGRIHEVRPHVLHLMRGQVFDIEGYTFFTMGGASSHDIQDGILDPEEPGFEERYWRMRRARAMFRVKGVSWWTEELPSDEEYEEARKNLDAHDWAVDYILTHCAPTSITQKIIPHARADRLTDFLEEVKNRARYHYWLFGHLHDNQAVDKKHILLWEQVVQVI